MKLLLTSGGIKNPSIHGALVSMLDKPIVECAALCIPTANYAHRNGTLKAWQFVNGASGTPMVELGWKSVGLLELTSLPSLDESIWAPQVEAADVLLVNGGDPLYLNYWMQQSGLAALLPSLDVVYVGLSAGSMIMAPRIGQEFVNWTPPTGGDETLGFVDFAIFPHLDHPMLPSNTLPSAEKWAVKLAIPAYAICDDTAIKVVDGEHEIVSKGHWQRFN